MRMLTIEIITTKEAMAVRDSVRGPAVIEVATGRNMKMGLAVTIGAHLTKGLHLTSKYHSRL
jgi:hypothetical protein